MIKITSQDPVHKHIFTTLLHNIRYDVSVKHNTVHKCGFNDKGSFSRRIDQPVLVERFVKAVNDHVENNNIDLGDLVKRQFVLIETVGSCIDLRVTGSNLDTGKRAIFNVNGKNQGYKIYMTNNGNCLQCYIKQKGKNKTLLNDQLIGSMTPHRLINLVNWYFEK